MTSTSSGNEPRHQAAARHARAADEVGVREWAQLLVERGQQLLARASRDPRGGSASRVGHSRADRTR